VPTEAEKKDLKVLLPELNKLQYSLCNNTVHGFMPLRSAVTNAKAHIGKQFTLCFDLKDFFDTVTRSKVTAVCDRFAESYYDKCFVDNVARQGLPTSPAIANIAAIKLDAGLSVGLRLISTEIVYTRYADDLTISFDDGSLVERIKELVRDKVIESGFELAAHKTTLYKASAGYRKVTGVSVGSDAVYPTRESKRKLRAAKHQGNESSTKGLEEWQKLKVPPDADTNLSRICIEFGIPVVTPPPKQVSIHEVVGSNFSIQVAPEIVLAAAHVNYGKPSRLLLGKGGKALLNWAIDPRVCIVCNDNWNRRLTVGNTTIEYGWRSSAVTLAILTEAGLVLLDTVMHNRNSRRLVSQLRRLGIKRVLTDSELSQVRDMSALKEIKVEIDRITRSFLRPSGVIIDRATKNKLFLRFYVEGDNAN
jgi:hypothetical protein